MDDAGQSRRPTKLVLAAIALFILAVLLGRLLVAGGAAWIVLAFALPVILLAFAASFGIRAAFVATAVFAAIVLALRWLLRENPAGWIALLLIPIVAITAMVVGKVLGQLRHPPQHDEAE